MNTVRLNITLPSSVNDDINHYAKELNEKKSHIISSALDMYFDYLDIRVAEKRLNDPNDEHIPMDDFFKELDADVHD
ncbi:MAG: CopG family transcriptional regulator [Sulfurimonas sp.]|nr:MAG: CopG family transcriptional regulator [Sulfurimonas sp.]